jgi:hypothetical protein
VTVTSPAFENEGPIPREYTCDGRDQSPEITVRDLPATTVTWALIVDDPDAPGGAFTHWVMWNLNPRLRTINANVPKDMLIFHGAQQGRNHFKRGGWGGPCPPSGKPHCYRFRVYALSVKLGLPASATAADVEQAMRGYIAGEGLLVGSYAR